ncbi:hypothetical protein J1N51_03440 [Psychrosphaera ytuae]|uniref:Uncharacterized protein n=1 Tax=Psychrosphaera ytuae TaxID=2820710 RepID=A0A975DF87_9GAMM|nr:hypothetical protein [Psychrosphaera ytuae]QTH64540.1 hypothetical protein J1N51_03440 [Psychrosphaera ytuae]
MEDLSLNDNWVIITSLVVLAALVIFYVLKDRISEFDIDLLKGVFKLSGKAAPKKSIPILNDNDNQPDSGVLGNFNGYKLLHNSDDVTEEIASILAKIPKKLSQTYMGTNLVAGNEDHLNSWLELAAEKRPKVDRILPISSPVDLYFCTHCVKLKEKYGANLNLYVFQSYNDAVDSPTTNYTVIDNNVVVTLPQFHHIANGLQVPSSTTGLSIKENSELASMVKEHLAEIQKSTLDKNAFDSVEQRLEAAKEHFWEDKKRYLLSIAYAISKNFRRTPELKARLRCFSVIGSVLDGGDCIPNDLDLVIVFDEVTQAVYNKCIAEIDEIIGIFSLKETNFELYDLAAPVKPNSDYSFPIQVMIHDASTVNQCSPFSSRDRLNKHLDFHGSLSDYLTVEQFKINELIDGNYGVSYCLERIRTRTLDGRKWSEFGGKMSYRYTPVPVNEGESLDQFIDYAWRWCFHNSLEYFQGKMNRLEGYNTCLKNEIEYLRNQSDTIVNKVDGLEKLQQMLRVYAGVQDS